MGRPLEIKVDARSVAPHMQKKDRQFDQAVDRALKQVGLFVEAEVKESVAGHRNEMRSVDTGRFLNSIKTEVQSDHVSIGTGVEYAPFLEYGTVKMQERRHFRNTKARNEKRIRKFFADEIRKASDLR